MDQQLLKEFNALAQGQHYNPHQILGLHEHSPHQKVIRLFRPGAQEIQIEVSDQIVTTTKVHDSGIFEYLAPAYLTYSDYRVYHQDGSLSHDPYAFWPTIGQLDEYLFNQGVHYELFSVLGAQLIKHQGISGVKFSVWAPSAKSVSLVADFNHWNGLTNPMRNMGISGIWEIFVPAMQEGLKYKFEVKTQMGDVRIKSDPMAFAAEMRPSTASVVFDLNQYAWKDQTWMNNRSCNKEHSQPINIYEIHLGSWKKKENDVFLTYRELAHEVAAYCKEMGFTYVELMPIAEHPLDESWGYQVTGFYAITSRYGSPRDFQYFVDYLHEQNIGIIIDWVPAHFPTDDFSLARFDGTALYEHEDPKQGFHPHWNTYIFNYGRKEVSNFLLANAIFWCEKMHIDGLRVDAVSSMLYLDYGRESGEWVPNQYGGKENLEAIELLKHLNSVLHNRFPGVLLIAEESTAFSGITSPINYNGLGFDMKWNMGWMHDTLKYFAKDPLYRSFHHNDLTFGLIYAFSERFTLVLSHDEVVHGKNSLISKMPGDTWQKFANLRLLYSYMICQPGKKLLFMGGEIGQWNEWNCKQSIEWHLLQFPTHQGMQTMVRELNHFYINHPALWENDFNVIGFEWIDFADQYNSIISYRRKSMHGELVCVHNFIPTYHSEYVVHLPNVKSIKEVFNSDSEHYSGSGKINAYPKIIFDEKNEAKAISIQIAPLATMIFDVQYH